VSSSDQFGFNFLPPPRQVWTVRDLVSAVRTAIEREYTDVFVEGEISNLRPAESGHIYFTLKDGDAQMPVVMFRSQARLLRFKPENGLQIIARGRVTIYEARGQMQLAAEYLEPKGAGALQVAFEQLKAKLAAEGLFDAANKKPLPALPRRIGVVTSPRGAAIQDILNILKRRHENVGVLIYPAQVQGEAAAKEVAAGVRYFNSMKKDAVDVIIIARGGGSAEDLAAFNDEGLARTIAASKIPTVSAVGHETDFTIADFVADLRAPTPSAAAEMVIRSKQEISGQVAGLQTRLHRAARYRLVMARQHLMELARHDAFTGMRNLLGRRQQKLDELSFRMRNNGAAILRLYRQRVDVAATRIRAHDVRQLIGSHKATLDHMAGRAGAAWRARLQAAKSQVERETARLQALSPVGILERGYALVFDANGVLVKDAASLKPGDEIRARFAKGERRAKIKE
jgi:exodeoxyribonuclease VII large subunit